MTEQLGTEKIEALLKSVKQLVILAKKIKEDGKVDLNDLPHIVAFLPVLPQIIENFKEVSKAWGEIKDIDAAELINLIQVIDQAVKEIEQA